MIRRLMFCSNGAMKLSMSEEVLLKRTFWCRFSLNNANSPHHRKFTEKNIADTLKVWSSPLKCNSFMLLRHVKFYSLLYSSDFYDLFTPVNNSDFLLLGWSAPQCQYPVVVRPRKCMQNMCVSVCIVGDTRSSHTRPTYHSGQQRLV